MKTLPGDLCAGDAYRAPRLIRRGFRSSHRRFLGHGDTRVRPSSIHLRVDLRVVRPTRVSLFAARVCANAVESRPFTRFRDVDYAVFGVVSRRKKTLSESIRQMVRHPVCTHSDRKGFLRYLSRDCITLIQASILPPSSDSHRLRALPVAYTKCKAFALQAKELSCERACEKGSRSRVESRNVQLALVAICLDDAARRPREPGNACFSARLMTNDDTRLIDDVRQRAISSRHHRGVPGKLNALRRVVTRRLQSKQELLRFVITLDFIIDYLIN